MTGAKCAFRGYSGGDPASKLTEHIGGGVKLPSHLRIHIVSWLSVAVLTAASLVGLFYLLSEPGLAQLAPGTTHVSGAGAAAFQGDPDPVPACTFDLDALDSDPPSGTFHCEMSQQAIDLGIPFAQMDGVVSGFDPTPEDQAQLSGTATLGLPDGTQMDEIPFLLRVVAGGPDQGALRIRLIGTFDGEPGDAKPGNGDYDQWRQSLTEGSIEIDSEPSPTPSESPSPTPSISSSPTPSPTPSETPSPTPSNSTSPPPSPTPSPTSTGELPTPTLSVPPVRDAPVPATGANSTARLMALLAAISSDGIPQLADVLSVVGPFPVAGLTWWTDDWHAYRCCPYPHVHQGLDMFASTGTPVVAAADGYVSQKVVNSISGLGLEITDAANTQYFYAHLSRFATGVAVGTRVSLGEVVGYVGNTGDAIRTSPHLHFEVQPNGVPVPPKPFVDGWLILAEQKAEALAEARTGQAILNPADLDRWLALARALQPQAATGEGSGEASFDGHGALASLQAPPAPGAGAMVALASAMLLFLLVLPACFVGRRDARLAGRRASGGGASARSSASTSRPRGQGPPVG
jgi:murein DD-endopeptidase MepM/ murein hydrolase activator NlpD